MAESKTSGTPGRFEAVLEARGISLAPRAISTLQVNVTRVCNQACRHCHVDASPKRTEEMSRLHLQRCLEIVRAHPMIETIDITGGAPELHPHFEWFVSALREAGRGVIVRHNLTVQIDGDPRDGGSKSHLPVWFAEQRVAIVASLPYFSASLTDQQRGRGVFEKSIEGMRRLNRAGYGTGKSGLTLDLVYNPVGPYLPPNQGVLEARYKSILSRDHGVFFDRLFTLTNMPIRRFRSQLERQGMLGEYIDRLERAFSQTAVQEVMCRDLISVGYDGSLYDCDFNQMADVAVEISPPMTLDTFDLDRLLARRIAVRDHCFGCTAGAGSSCGGALVNVEEKRS